MRLIYYAIVVFSLDSKKTNLISTSADHKSSQRSLFSAVVAKLVLTSHIYSLKL